MLKPTQQHQASRAGVGFTLHYRCTVNGLCRILPYCRFLYISSMSLTYDGYDEVERGSELEAPRLDIKAEIEFYDPEIDLYKPGQ